MPFDVAGFRRTRGSPGRFGRRAVRRTRRLRIARMAVVVVTMRVVVVSVRVTMVVVGVRVTDVAVTVVRVRDAERVKTCVLVDGGRRRRGVLYFGALGDGLRRGRGLFPLLHDSSDGARRRALHGSTGARRRTAAIAAPKPLSTLTTVTPEAQLVSMPKSAVMPANATP